MNKANDGIYLNQEEMQFVSKGSINQSHNNETIKPILVLSIEISQGERELLRIYPNSQPEKLAYEFCNKHNLDYTSLQLLTNQIGSVIKGNLKTYSQLIADSSLKSSVVSGSSPNIKQKGQDANELQSIRFESPSHGRYKQMNSTSRHSLSYLIPTCSSRSKSKSRPQPAQKEESLTSASHKPPRTKTPTSSSFPNSGERLYFRGKKLQEKKEERIDLMKKQMMKSSSAIYTFKPKINAISTEAMRNRITNRLTYDEDSKILNYNEYVSNRINSLKQKHCGTAEYTFTPSISKRSLQIDQSKPKPSASRHEMLYDNYKKQQFDIEALSSQIYDMNVLFKPQINNTPSQYTIIPFEERQKYFTTKREEKRKMLREQLEAPEDEKTGQKLFHPEINNFERASCIPGHNIFNLLYTEALRTQRRKKEIEENKRIEGQICSNCSHVNVDSEDIYENKKAKCFEQIFALLDRDKDGVITKRSIEIKALPKQIANILSPIIEELKAEDETLNEDEFVTACFHLFNMLEYIEKKQLLTFTMSSNVNQSKTC